MEFKHALDVQERKVTHMLIGKTASESRKLEYLIDDDFDRAIAVVNEQHQEFNKAIAAVNALDTRNLPKATDLQQSKIAYYQSLKNLHVYAGQEIEQQKLIYHAKGKAKDEAQDELIRLAKAKQALYEKVYQAEETLYKALAEFDEANGL